MQFEVTKEYIEELKDAIYEGRDSFLLDQVQEMHPADVAEILDHLRTSEASYLFKLLTGERAADVLVELEEDVREKLLATLTSAEIAQQVIDHIDSDDAATVLSELPDDKINEVISHIRDREQASDLQDLLTYEDDTAGGLMAKELVKVRADWTIARAIREMRKQAEDVDEVYNIYVVDADDRLLGTLSLKKLLFTSSSIKTPISEIFNPKEIRYVNANQSAEEAAKMMEKYDLVAMAVVDDDMRLIGRITIDDVVDVIKEEAEKDYALASGISTPLESDDSTFMMLRARLPWLLIGLAGGLVNATLLGGYEDAIAAIPTLAFFMPLITATAGNVGVQSSAIIVQGLANQSLSLGGVWPKLGKEFLIALLNAIVIAAIAFGFSVLYLNSYRLGMTVAISLLTVIILAALLGTIVPFILEKYNIDPALATGPFITTSNDILGLWVYFTMGQLIYSYA